MDDENSLHSVSEIFEQCVGCKWTVHVLSQIRHGVHRPGQLQRSADGLTTKVLNERLVKLVRFGIIEKTMFNELPPRVEYSLTQFGERFVKILDQVEQLQQEIEHDGTPRSSND